jgi:hypothetical protein
MKKSLETFVKIISVTSISGLVLQGSSCPILVAERRAVHLQGAELVHEPGTRSRDPTCSSSHHFTR